MKRNFLNCFFKRVCTFRKGMLSKMQKIYRGSSCLMIDKQEFKLDYYIVQENKSLSENEKPRATYGIEIIKNGNESEIVRDITLNADFALDIIDKLKENTVMPVHLHDVIENLI